MFNILRKNAKRQYYDSILLMALALNNSIHDLRNLSPPRRLEDFTYEDDEMTEIFNQNIRHMDFVGVSVSKMSFFTRCRGFKIIFKIF